MAMPRTLRFLPALARTARRCARCERGASAIEFAMIGSFLVIVLLNVVDIGLFYYHKMEVTSAVRAGAQYALVSDSPTDQTITTVVTNATNLSDLNVTVNSDLCYCWDGGAAVAIDCSDDCSDSKQYYTDIAADYTHTWIFYPGTTSITANLTIRTQ